MKKTALLLCLSLSACVSSGVKTNPENMQALHKGETTYSEALQLLGKPSQVIRMSDGSKTAMYFYFSSQARPESFIPVVGAFVGGADVENTSATLRFDKNEVLTDYTSTAGSSGVGRGFEGYSQPRTEVNGKD